MGIIFICQIIQERTVISGIKLPLKQMISLHQFSIERNNNFNERSIGLFCHIIKMIISAKKLAAKSFIINFHQQ
jgi:hypothetical protein